MRLGVGVLGAEQLAGPGVGQVLDGVDVVAAGVEPAVRDALGVLVGQQVAHGALHGQRRVVLAGDQLDVAPLVGQLLHDRTGHLGRDPGHALEIGQVRQESGRDPGGVLGLAVAFDQGSRHERARLVKDRDGDGDRCAAAEIAL